MIINTENISNECKREANYVLNHAGIGQGKFEKEVDLGNGFVNNVGFSIRKKSIDKISEKYPELNISWLLTGEGIMLKSDIVRNPDYSEEISKLIAENIRQQAQINTILKTVEVLSAAASKMTVSLVSSQMQQAAEEEAGRIRKERSKAD